MHQINIIKHNKNPGRYVNGPAASPARAVKKYKQARVNMHILCFCIVFNSPCMCLHRLYSCNTLQCYYIPTFLDKNILQ